MIEYAVAGIIGLSQPSIVEPSRNLPYESEASSYRMPVKEEGDLEREVKERLARVDSKGRLLPITNNFRYTSVDKRSIFRPLKQPSKN